MFTQDRKRLTRILARAEAGAVCDMARRLQEAYPVTVVKAPGRTLAMITAREPVRAGLYYLAETVVWEAVVALDGARGMAATMADSAEKALAMAVIDAAVTRGVFSETETLLRWETEQESRAMREHALHLQTMVHFTSMDAEMPT